MLGWKLFNKLNKRPILNWYIFWMHILKDFYLPSHWACYVTSNKLRVFTLTLC